MIFNIELDLIFSFIFVIKRSLNNFIYFFYKYIFMKTSVKIYLEQKYINFIFIFIILF